MREVSFCKRPEGGSPGLVVISDNSCLKGHGFKCILDGQFFTLICCKKYFLKKDRKKMKKRPGLAHFFFKKKLDLFSLQSFLWETHLSDNVVGLRHMPPRGFHLKWNQRRKSLLPHWQNLGPQFIISGDIIINWTLRGDLYLLLQLTPQWWGRGTDHGATLEDLYFLPAIAMGKGFSVTRRKLPNVYQSFPKMISLEKW